MNKQTEIATVFILAVALLGAVAIPMVYASTTEEEEEEAPPAEEEETTAPAPPATTTLGSTIVPPAAPAAPAAGEDFVRARVMLFGVPPNSPNIVAWVNVPAVNATSADSITATELDATNNVTGDGIGEMFLSLPNVTSAINQQIQACALDVTSLLPKCDDAFQASTNASTMLQLLLGNPQQPAAAAAIAGGAS